LRACKPGLFDEGVIVMKMPLRIRKISVFVVFICAVVLLGGCMVAGRKYKGEECFQKDQIEKILPGKTTKQEILLWFGPPLAIARKGKVIKIPSPDVQKTSSYELHSDTFLELFSGKHEITENHIVYYYTYSEMKGTETVVVFAGTGNSKLVVDKLWILINKETGIVEDYVFREQE